MQKLFTVYQPNLNKFLDDGQFKSRDLMDKHFKMTHKGEVTPSEFRNYYGTPVCSMLAKDLNHVFEIGNIGPESAIMRFDKMHSVSVGDVIVDSTSGKYYVVKPLGFMDLASQEMVN
jgi:hypothetical protein